MAHDETDIAGTVPDILDVRRRKIEARQNATRAQISLHTGKSVRPRSARNFA